MPEPVRRYCHEAVPTGTNCKSQSENNKDNSISLMITIEPGNIFVPKEGIKGCEVKSSTCDWRKQLAIIFSPPIRDP